MAHSSTNASLENLKLLKALDEGTASYTGEMFFSELVKNLALLLHTKGAWVTEFDRDHNRLHALAFWMDGNFIHDYHYAMKGTPCEFVIDEKRILHIPENVVQLFPDDPDLKPFNAVSYMGAPLLDSYGQVLGNLAILDDAVLPGKDQTFLIFKIFSARAAAELERIRSEQVIHENERNLTLLLNSIMDAVIELDQNYTIHRVNRAAEKVFKCSQDELLMKNLSSLLSIPSFKKITGLCDKLDSLPRGSQYLWVPGVLNASCNQTESFEAEATLSRYELNGAACYSLILRNISDKLSDQKKIEALQAETIYLRDEVFSSSPQDMIIGSSQSFIKVLRQADQVAFTDATVLISGETGTGKEMMAKRIHRLSKRNDKPFIKLNCASIPPTLIESELFGHVKGAFTDASGKRDGRFTLAHNGTLFLDEIGELPVTLQPKLLRVLQEGEFEPVGSSETVYTDVRIIAATNQDLPQMIKENKFREDLYYRLNIFPIHLPPLRERTEDIKNLVNMFLDKFNKQYIKQVQPPEPHEWKILLSYQWPGNIRELQNFLERAVITSQNNKLNLVEQFPGTKLPRLQFSSALTGNHAPDHWDRILKDSEVRELERINMIRALESCGGVVSGKNGAAHQLGIPATTFYSRMKSLHITSHKYS